MSRGIEEQAAEYAKRRQRVKGALRNLVSIVILVVLGIAAIPVIKALSGAESESTKPRRMSAPTHSTPTPTPTTRPPIQSTATPPSTTDDLAAAYETIRDIRDKADFAEKGFGAGGPYREVMEAIKAAASDARLPILHREAWGHLRAIGMQYAVHGPADTEYSTWACGIIENLIAGTPPVEAPAVDASLPDEEIGEWVWRMPGVGDCSIRIYVRDGRKLASLRYGDGSGSTVELSETAPGVFREVDSRSGEGFRVLSDGDLELFDNEGAFDRARRR